MELGHDASPSLIARALEPAYDLADASPTIAVIGEAAHILKEGNSLLEHLLRVVRPVKARARTDTAHLPDSPSAHLCADRSSLTNGERLSAFALSNLFCHSLLLTPRSRPQEPSGLGLE